MKLIISVVVILIFCSEFKAQQGSKIKLKNVSVSDIKLPTVFLFGKEYTARQRNTLIKEILSSRFYDPNFRMEVNFQEFISNKNFSFIHKGPTEIIINSSKLTNRNLFKTYHGYSDVEMPNKERINSFVERVKAVYIDSSRNGILKSKELKKDILIINQNINQKKNKFNSDSTFQIDDYIIKLERRKKRIEKKLNSITLVQIKILTR
ncbi:MAG: hypothetical protein EVA36_01445 [Flavobacteriales bacterium]|nr:MAG: hypothetical protein CBC56_007395 [Flavobacteriales bacterium TMED96]RZP12245.1 MAG: hypothetical protein EVA36_01445 [Flavobacteriales bacterium]